MVEIRIKLDRNKQAQDWHIEINGIRYVHLTTQNVEDLVEATVIMAENAVIKEATLRLQ